MNLCSDNHDEICYEGRYCPLCDMRDELDESITELEREINDLRNTITDLEREK